MFLRVLVTIRKGNKPVEVELEQIFCIYVQDRIKDNQASDKKLFSLINLLADLFPQNKQLTLNKLKRNIFII